MKKKCKGCGMWFDATKNQRFCTEKCYKAHYYRQKKENERAEADEPNGNRSEGKGNAHELRQI